jgi:uncharacterized repeat protein (TIGR03803 family)
MNHVRKQDKRFRTFAAFVAAIGMLVLAGAAVPAQAQTYTVLYAIPNEDSDVYGPISYTISQGRNGDVYASSLALAGELFTATTSGVLTPLYTAGGGSVSGEILGTDGNLYATNHDGGTVACGLANCGSVFKVTPAGVATTLHSFSGTDGSAPDPPLVEAPNGLFYGVTFYSSTGYGVIYEINSTGMIFKVLHTFMGGTTDGAYPHAGLVVGSDGNLYGGTSSGGTNNDGVLYRITPAGAYKVLYNLCSQSNCTDGYDIENALVSARDGNLYGITYRGGVFSGVIFRLTTSGTYTVINTVTPGEPPITQPMVQGSDGNLYGIVGVGASGQDGQIYSVTTAGVMTILHNFCQAPNCTDGYGPSTPLVQHTDGLFYGFTELGGVAGTCSGGGGCGVFYSFDMGLGAFALLESTSGKEGAKIGILGQGFSRSSVVKFGGVQATTVTGSGSTFLTATVPAAALTGAVTVTTGSTTLKSSQTFRVTPTMASFSPPSGPVGQLVTINGTGLMQTAKVTFNGESASFTVVSDIEVTATVPTGATTGKIKVTTKGGSVTSATSFTVN